MTKTIKQVIQSSKAVHVFVVILIANVWTKKENIFIREYEIKILISPV